MKKLLFFCLLAGLVTGLSAKVKVTFTEQWGEVGLCNKLPISLDNYRGIKVEFDGTVADNIQLKIQNATDQDDTNTYPAQYQPVENGASQIAIDFDTEHFGSDRTVTVLNLQNKVTSQVVVIIKRIALVKTDGTEEECSYDGSVGWGRTIEVLSDDTPGGDDNPGGDDPTPGVDTGTSDKIEAETMTPGGSYAGTCTSPFAGMAFYGNGDCATKTVAFPVKNGMYTVGVRGASSNNSGAGIALYVNGKKLADFTFYITEGDTKYADCKVLLGDATTAEVKLNLETDNGSNDTYVDYITFTLQNEMQERTAPVLPSRGAYYTNTYRNLFVEAGYSETKVNERLDEMWDQLFYGSDGRDDGQRVYYEVGTDEAYILDVNNDDVRSEGQSYGMMICVQMNKQTEFNKLWKWAKSHMQHEDGEFKGYFAWVMNKDGSKREASPAPDGEEYFITALMFAANRWGNGEGIYNYMAEANAILENSWNKPDVANYPYSDVKPLFDKTEKQVVFVPFATSATKTDPSYHLPAFYRLWAAWADNHKDFYTQLAEKSHDMFPLFAHATTGLMPDYANFDGTPNGEGGHNNFRFDAWRCLMNMGCDYAWFADCSDEVTLVKRAHDFFYSKGVKEYYSNYTLDGNMDSGNTSHSAGLVACNAVGALASNDIKAWDFVDDLWETPIPSGRYRYYDGMLYFMGFLHASGNFRIYKPDGAILVPYEIALQDALANTTTIAANDDRIADVTLSGRTLKRDGSWNTLCLPFDVTAEQISISDHPLYGATIMELDTDGWYDGNTRYDEEAEGRKQTCFAADGTLYLYFKEATEIDARVPYLVKWSKPTPYTAYDGTNASTCSDIVNPEFPHSEIEASSPEAIKSNDGKVSFVGNYDPVNIPDEDKSILYLGDDNQLYYPNAAMSINSFRAYFHVDLGTSGGVANTRMFFGGDETTSLPQPLQREGSLAGAWFDLSGRKLSGKPTRKGIYVYNGKKRVIK